MEAWTMVKVKNKDLEHDGQAGVVQSVDNAAKPPTATVKMDLDPTGDHVVFDQADLQVLGQ